MTLHYYGLRLFRGGVRSAAFAYGVLDQLSKEQYIWGNQRQSLLSQFDYVRGVSGGSIVGAYYALYGESQFKNLKKDLLYKDFQGDLIGRFFDPQVWIGLISKKYGRSHVMAGIMNRLFQRKTFKDLRQGAYAHLTVVSNDLTYNTPFEFTAEQFNFICSSLDDVQLSLAISASSAVPILFDPISLKNYTGQCDVSKEMLKRYKQLTAYGKKGRSFYQEKAYYSMKNKQYIHLADGGVSDNLGVQYLMDKLSFQMREHVFKSKTRIKNVVMLVVNAMASDGKDIDDKAHITERDVMWVISGNILNKQTKKTIQNLELFKRQWKRYVATLPYRLKKHLSSNVKFHLIVLNLSEFRKADQEINQRVLNIGTTLTLKKEDVDILIQAGREVLEESHEFQLLKRVLKVNH